MSDEREPHDNLSPHAYSHELEQLKLWVELQLPLVVKNPTINMRKIQWQPINGDAGFRQYYRLSSDLFKQTYLAVFAPLETENTEAFVDIANFFTRNGVRAPKIYACVKDKGFLLIEDFGDNLLHPNLNEETVNGLYGQTLTALLHMQTLEPSDIFPPYSHELLCAEMQFFPTWFVERLLGHTLSSAEKSLIDTSFEFLASSALEQTQVIVHRDFHSRNILLDSSQTPAFIDFQDAVIGPVTYDLVSLLKDCYICWPQEQVERWALAYGNLLLDAQVINDVTGEQFLKWFHLMGLQRHIKVLGIFARLYLRDNKARYLNDLPLVIKYTQEVLERYPQLRQMSDWFNNVIMPLALKQSWMRND